jgi:predicted nucleotidyltransferase
MREPWASTPELRLTALLERLSEAQVDFVVVGGVAVIVQASPRFTRDLDICYATDSENLDRLGALLTELGARLRGHTQMLTLATPDGDLDLLVDPDGSPGYGSLRRNASRVDLDGITVLVASIDDLIAMKRAAGRPQDLVDLESLEIARGQLRRRSS